MYSLSEQDLDIQARARSFADELVPLEVDVELAGGEVPAAQEAKHTSRAIELGLYAPNIPKSVGGGGGAALQDGPNQGEVGRVTNGPAWVGGAPPARPPRRAPPDP